MSLRFSQTNGSLVAFGSVKYSIHKLLTQDGYLVRLGLETDFANDQYDAIKLCNDYENRLRGDCGNST